MARIYIYGSCVSRDSFDFLDKSEHELLGYTARQSLISANGSPYLAAADGGTLESRFQIRNLQGDFDGSIFRTLVDVAPQVDYIFWDLTDERLGVIKVGPETYITRSVELLQSGLLDRIEGAEWIKFGTAEHFELWQQAVINFAEFARSNSIHTKLILLNLPWSMHDEQGVLVKKSWDMLPDEANNLLARYAAVLQNNLDIACIQLPWKQAVSNTQHKWSLAPYHYQDHVYEAVASQFAEYTMYRAGELTPLTVPNGQPDGNSDSIWHDAFLDPQTVLIEPSSKSFGLQFDANSSISPGHKLLISLKLEGADGLQLYKNRITKSVLAHVGHFRYMAVDTGFRSYFAGFDLPEGVSCTSLTVMGWQIAKGQIRIGNVSVF